MPFDDDRPLAISYLRFSTPAQEKGDSYRRQSQAAEKYALSHGLRLDEELRFEDRGVSAFRGLNSTSGALAAIMELARTGEIPHGTYLLVEGLDRLSRQDPFDASYELQGVIRAGLNVVTLADKAVYSRETMSGPDGIMKMFASLMIMSRAHEESRTKGDRVAAKWEEKRAAAANDGRRLTKIAPAWLKARTDTTKAGPEGWDVDEEKAAIVRRVFELGRDGYGKERAAATLQADGVPTLGRGAKWHASSVAKLWANPAVIGTATPHRVEVEDGKKRRIPEDPIPGYFPAIVEEELWADVQAAREAKRPRGKSAAAPIRNPFAGVGRCAHCGSAVTRVEKGKKSRPKLVCTAAKRGQCQGGYATAPMEDVEAALADQLPQLIADAPLGETTEHLEAKLEGLRVSIEEQERLVYGLIRDRAADPTPANKRAAKDAERELDELRVQADELDATIVQAAPASVRSRMAALEALAMAEEADAAALSRALQRACTAVSVDVRGGFADLQWRQGDFSRVWWSFSVQ
ncbi:MAG: recombinase family protein [Oceanicaulis sp.]